MNPARWRAYLAISLKAEAQGKGNDDNADDIEMRQYIALFVKHCPPEQYMQVFDPGAGAGLEIKLLKEAGYKPIGFTFGKDNVELAKTKYGVTLLEQDFHMPTFNDGSFDAIFSVQTAEHALSMHIMMIEFWRILRVGGRWFCDTATCNDGMFQVWHTNLHPHDSWVKYGEVYGFKVAADESQKDRTTIIFEKQPPEQGKFYGYWHHVYEALAHTTNSE